jgi:hypothetical protein
MEFKITEKQINDILLVLGEIPAKLSFNVIAELRSLPVITDQKTED